MKVLLVDAPFDAEDVGGAKADFDAVRNVIPALGLLYLAAVAERAGHEAAIVDCARGLPVTAVDDGVRAFEPDLVGFTATTPTFTSAAAAARRVRDLRPAATLVVGGPHPSVMPEHALREGPFDIAVIGEGDATFAELLAHLSTGSPASLDEVAGLAFLRDGSFVRTAPRPLIEDLDDLPLPARHLLPPLAAYSPTPASYRHLPLAHVMTSRGCPSRCTFCDRGVFGESFRGRSPEAVLAEVDDVVGRYGAAEIRFFDDTFTLDRRRVEAICDGLRRRRPPVPWTCLTRVSCVDEDLMRSMRSAGCWQVLFGLESGDDDVLKSLHKGATVEQNRRAVLQAAAAGLRVRADFIVGTPAETPESLERTMAFAKSLPIDFAHFNKFVPFPGTEIYQRLAADGFSWDFSERSSTLDHSAMVYVPPALNEADYRRFLDTAYRRFYLRPGFLVRRLLAMRTWTEFWGHLKGFGSIASM